jgi:hypothetical protein
VCLKQLAQYTRLRLGDAGHSAWVRDLSRETCLMKSLECPWQEYELG